MTALSIVIPSHNRPDLLQICLHSVYKFSPNGIQIIVIDDASSDETQAICKLIPDINYVRLERNQAVPARKRCVCGGYASQDAGQGGACDD